MSNATAVGRRGSAVPTSGLLCAGQARLFAGALRERTSFLNGVKPIGKLGEIKEASPAPVR